MDMPIEEDLLRQKFQKVNKIIRPEQNLSYHIIEGSKGWGHTRRHDRGVV